MHRREVEKRSGAGLFVYYSSLSKALQSVYPEYPWQPSKFRLEREKRERVPVGYWQDKEHLLEVLQSAEEKLGISKVNFYSFSVLLGLFSLLPYR